MELPPSPLLSPSPLCGSRGQKMRPPAAKWWGGRGAAGTRQGPLRKKNYFYFHIDPYRPPGGRGIEL